MKFSCIPPETELGKVWYGMSRNQGVAGDNDEQYKCQRKFEGTLAGGRIDGIHHYNYCKATSNQHHMSFDIPDMDSQVEESKST